MINSNNFSKFGVLKARRQTRPVQVGNMIIGGQAPISVQTMTNTDTLNVEATVKQTIECVEAGAELVRITVPTPKHAQAFKEIKEKLRNQKYLVPLIADIHFLPSAAIAVLPYSDKIRINPGNFLDKRIFKEEKLTDKIYKEELQRIEKELIPYIEKFKQAGKPIRIGTNHGSMSDRITNRYGNTPVGMVEATMEYLRMFKRHDFHEIVVALKASDPLIMIEANRLLVSEMAKEDFDCPIHLGVTEAGNASEGRAKSTIGTGTLLLEGIGDTIRVSLTEDPINEPVEGYNILQACHRRITKAEFISCPSCGRTLYNIQDTVNLIKKELSHLKGLKIGVMGCAVNGPGEMADADFGYVGGAPGKINLYKGKELMKSGIPQEEALSHLIQLIKDSGRWIEKK
jgi:(E)-4-hydroxy-3-methylbut-2-enyl-diphosphate synthase